METDEDDDIHICGKCRLEFHSLNTFVKHKNSCPGKQRRRDGNNEGLQCTIETAAAVASVSAAAASCSPTIDTVVESTTSDSSPIVVSTTSLAPDVLVGEEMQIHLDTSDEQMVTEETVETAPDQEEIEGDEDCDDDDGDVDGRRNAIMIGGQMHLTKQEVLFDADSYRGNSHGVQVFDLPPPTGDEDQTMSLFSLDADGNMVELPLKYPSENKKPAVSTESHFGVNESILDSSAFMPVTLGEVIAAPCGANAESGEESSGMVPTLDVPVRLGPKIFPCSYDGCNYVTKYAKDLQRHLLVHTGEKPFVCGECKKAFNRIDKLKIHQRIHSGYKPFRCQFCDYACSERSAMKKHMRTHSDDRPFKCMICPYASRNSSQLIVHLRTHTGDAPFQCHICASKFKVNSDLKRHMRTHTGEKPFKCPHCEYRCSVKSNLKPHILLNHEPTEIQKCLVPNCGFQTNTKGEFKAHQRTHSDYKQSVRPVTLNCQLCNYKCSNKTNLTMHMQTDHTAEGKKTIQEVLENGPFICTFCSFTAKFQSNLRKHVRKNHPEALITNNRSKKDADPNSASNNNNVGVSGPETADAGGGKKNLAAAVLAAALRIKKGSIKQQQSKAARANALRTARAAMAENEKKLYPCSFCEKSFSRQDMVETHCKNRHQDEHLNVLSANAFVLQQLQQQRHDGSTTTVLEAAKLHDPHHRLHHQTGLQEDAAATATIQTDSGQFINVQMISGDKLTSLDGGIGGSGSIILQPLGAADVSTLKPVQILASHPMNGDQSIFDQFQVQPQHSVSAGSTTAHQPTSQFNPANIMAVNGPDGQTHHITLHNMGQAIPTSVRMGAPSTHHVIEATDGTSLPVIQAADGQTHYVIIQPH